jgi:hypothetical protein
MKLTEITSQDFKDKLTDPIQFMIKDSVAKLRDIIDNSNYKMGKVNHINHSGRDIIKFTVHFPNSFVIDYPEDVNELQRIVFDPFRDITEPKMNDAIYVGTGGRPYITFIYYLKR